MPTKMVRRGQSVEEAMREWETLNDRGVPPTFIPYDPLVGIIDFEKVKKDEEYRADVYSFTQEVELREALLTECLTLLGHMFHRHEYRSVITPEHFIPYHKRTAYSIEERLNMVLFGERKGKS